MVTQAGVNSRLRACNPMEYGGRAKTSRQGVYVIKNFSSMTSSPRIRHFAELEHSITVYVHIAPLCQYGKHTAGDDLVYAQKVAAT